MELSVMICDDLAEERRTLRQILRQYSLERGCQLHMEEAASGEEMLSHWNPERWDIILLDIYMPGLSGVETARRLRRLNDTCAVVFVTYSQFHGLIGYDLGISDYLVKPINQSTVFDMLDWCVQQQREALRTLRICSDWEQMEVRLRDIRYIEIRRHTACINLKGKQISTRRGIAELEKEIDSQNFLRCHRSFLVNLAYVQTMQGNDFIMEGGQHVPVSAMKTAFCKRRLMDWIIEQAWSGRRSQKA